MLPPPAPTVLMSICADFSGIPAIWPSFFTVGVSSRIMLTSVLVPPMSQVMRSRSPAAAADCTAATTPPAGPERTVATGKRRARSTESTPPLEAMMKRAPRKPRPRRTPSSLAR